MTELNFKEAIKETGFKPYPEKIKKLCWCLYINNTLYELHYEGNAYVLYKEITLYIKPLKFLLNFYNKFVKKSAEIAVTYNVPIADFVNPNKFVTFINILKDNSNVQNYSFCRE